MTEEIGPKPLDEVVPPAESVELPPEQRDFYQKLRDRVRTWEMADGRNYKWLEYTILAPDLFHLMVKLSLDKDIPIWYRTLLGAGIAYFMSPVDIIPDIMPGVGWLDDIAVAALIISLVVKDVDVAAVRRNWAGEGDIIEIVRRTTGTMSKVLGKQAFHRVGRWVKRKARGNHRGATEPSNSD